MFSCVLVVISLPDLPLFMLKDTPSLPYVLKKFSNFGFIWWQTLWKQRSELGLNLNHVHNILRLSDG